MEDKSLHELPPSPWEMLMSWLRLGGSQIKQRPGRGAKEKEQRVKKTELMAKLPEYEPISQTPQSFFEESFGEHETNLVDRTPQSMQPFLQSDLDRQQLLPIQRSISSRYAEEKFTAISAFLNRGDRRVRLDHRPVLFEDHWPMGLILGFILSLGFTWGGWAKSTVAALSVFANQPVPSQMLGKPVLWFNPFSYWRFTWCILSFLIIAEDHAGLPKRSPLLMQTAAILPPIFMLVCQIRINTLTKSLDSLSRNPRQPSTINAN